MIEWLSRSPKPARAHALSLRNAYLADVPAMCGIYLAARAASMTYAPTLYSEAEISDWMITDHLRHCKVKLACLGPEIAGFSVLRNAWLEQLYVHPDHQGRGVGEALVNQAKRASSGQLRLHVFQQNLRARSFYARHGFMVEKLRDKSQNEEQVADMVCLWRATA